jgi:hypothetical protein
MNKYVIGTTILMMAIVLTVAIPTFAETKEVTKVTKTVMQRPENAGDFGRGPDGVMKPFVVGTVSTINSNAITVLGRTGFGKTVIATTTYIVDATNAKITKNNATSSISNIAVGDTVAVQGTITGTNIVATMIRDGVIGGPGIGFGKGQENKDDKIGTSTKSIITGNGQPIIAGTISTISGSTISVTNKSNVIYTVDATNAKILQNNKTVDLSTLKTGDAVIVQGTINGTSVVASSIIDQNKPANPGKSPRIGFFGGIGQFFTHLFGF